MEVVMDKFIRISVIAMSIFAIAAVTSCKSKTETYTSDKGSVKVDSEGEKADITITTEKGETYSMSVNKGELPKNWPSDIPVIPEGKILFAQSDSKGDMQQLSIETKTSMTDCLEFYKNIFNTQGWNVGNSMNMHNMQILNAKKDNRELMLQITEDDDKTIVHFIVKAGS